MTKSERRRLRRMKDHALANQQTKSTCENSQTNKNTNDTEPSEVVVSNLPELTFPVAVREYYEAQQRNNPSKWKQAVKFGVEVGGLVVLVWYAVSTSRTLDEIRKQTPSIQQSADAALRQERPWLKIRHRILYPLTFDVGPMASGKKIARATIQDTIENVGNTVALNVRCWEDIMPVGPIGETLLVEQKQKTFCDMARNPDFPNRNTIVVFPRDVPTIQETTVGVPMEDITWMMRQETAPAMRTIASIALVGCVCYRAPSDPPNAPTHQTRFRYYFGRSNTTGDGTFQAYITPVGIAKDLTLIPMLGGFTAD